MRISFRGLSIKNLVDSVVSAWDATTTVLVSLCAVTIWAIIVSRGVGAFSGAGDGTAINPFQIATCAQLQEMDNNLSAEYLIVNDIDCTSVSFSPIGLSSEFTGKLDGGGYSISGLSLSANTTATGLFARTNAAEIVDVHVIDIQIVESVASDGQYGALIGYMTDGSVTNCSASGAISQTINDYYTTAVGGLIGLADGNAQISDSQSSVNINMLDALYDSGGFIGETRDTVRIDRCSSSGYVQGGVDSYNREDFPAACCGWSC